MSELYPLEKQLREVDVGQISERVYTRRKPGTSDLITPKELIAEIEKLEKKALAEGCTDITCVFQNYEGGPDSFDRMYVTIKGKRLETDEEYIRRLESQMSRIKQDRDEFERKKRFYESKGAIERAQEVVEMIRKIEETKNQMATGKDRARVKALRRQLADAEAKIGDKDG